MGGEMGRERADTTDLFFSPHLQRKRGKHGGKMGRERAEAADPPIFPPFAKEKGGNGGEMGWKRAEAADPPFSPTWNVPSMGPTLKSISIYLQYSDDTAGGKTYTLHGAPRVRGRSPKCAHICTRILVSG